jgi:hypothetical protein
MERACCLCQISSDSHKEWGMRNMKVEAHVAVAHTSRGSKTKMAIKAKEASRSTYLDIGLSHIGRLMKLVIESI